jgi:hypothetical protein
LEISKTTWILALLIFNLAFWLYVASPKKKAAARRTDAFSRVCSVREECVKKDGLCAQQQPLLLRRDLFAKKILLLVAILDKHCIEKE